MLKSAPSRSGVAQPLARVTAQKRSYRKIDEEQVDLNEEFPTCRDFAEPSDGLEVDPSLPWRFWGGKAGHGRALAGTMCLQFGGFVDVGS